MEIKEKKWLDFICDIQDEALVEIIEEMRNGTYVENVENEFTQELIKFRESMNIKEIEVLEKYAEIAIEIGDLKDGNIQIDDLSDCTKVLLHYVLDKHIELIPLEIHLSLSFKLKGHKVETNYTLN
jgi:hypothetical protein